jgi:SnoaL-like domain
MTIDELLVIEEIRDLRHRYSALLDSHDLDGLTETFTDEAICDFGAEFGVWRGRAEIRRNYAAAMQAIGSAFDALHLVTNPWIRVAGPDKAFGRWYLLDFLTRQKPVTAMATRGGHEQPLFCLGVYEDDYVKVGNAWRFAHVKLHFLWPDRVFTGLRHTHLV